ncbi:heat shock protein Hsp90 [Piromyces finnis]|uniref:Heat shock protein Hsp90 n=1 Tax=Piromyces finnis TaxID=1754191 RepID=A0A1Y1VM14_9FUNG|nr:heat shock protein Hsp90 [Piromyces finnis]|eukprot:ORX58547.1 heat shock protein Hsp90 [Piromyces finnis]
MLSQITKIALPKAATLSLSSLQQLERVSLKSLKNYRAASVSKTSRRFLVTENSENKEEEDKIPEEGNISVNEKTIGTATKHEFKTETKRLLDIVAKSLYSDKEVFIRELISNASDALEKVRYLQLTDETVLDETVAANPAEIHLSINKSDRTIIFQDFGIGMNEDEVNNNLGTIANSGTLAFLKKLDQSSASAKENIIGQFGVGFYSCLMVAEKVEVYTKSAHKNAKGYCWTSDGSGSYDVAEADGVTCGTKIVIHLREDCKQFADIQNVQRIIKRYSNFVQYPIVLNGKRLNTIQALWTMNKNEITEDQHIEFYRFIANAHDKPQFTLLYKTDAPIQISSLLYVPQYHSETMGLGRMQPGVSLYSRKVLIQAKCKQLLPEWLRFVRGVVDSEDIPLNVSREMLQDNALIARLRNVLTTRVIKWLLDESKRDPEKYKLFASNFGNFLKEGICADYGFKTDIAALLRFPSTKTGKGEVTSFDEYVEKMQKDQECIFYTCTPNRSIVEDSPYYEPFKNNDIEVVLCHEAIDEFVMNNLHLYKGKRILNIESQAAAEEIAKKSKVENAASKLNETEEKEMIEWVKETLGKELVSQVTVNNRIASTPAILRDHDASISRKLMMMMPGSKLTGMPIPPQKIEINTSHRVICGLYKLRTTKPEVASEVMRQVYDNALISAGLLQDPRTIIRRLNKLMENVVSANVPETETSN